MDNLKLFIKSFFVTVLIFIVCTIIFEIFLIAPLISLGTIFFSIVFVIVWVSVYHTMKDVKDNPTLP